MWMWMYLWRTQDQGQSFFIPHRLWCRSAFPSAKKGPNWLARPLIAESFGSESDWHVELQSSFLDILLNL